MSEEIEKLARENERLRKTLHGIILACWIGVAGLAIGLFLSRVMP